MLSNSKNHALFLLALSHIALSASLYTQTLGWVSLLAVLAFVMRLALYLVWQKHLPSIRTLNLLALLSALVLAYYALQLDLLKAMLNLLVMACSLKLMVMRRQKDYLQLILCQLFMIACGFIFSQSILFSLFYALNTLLCILSLGFYFAPGLSFRQQVKRMAMHIVQASPIALVLFLVLPQLPPLWQMPARAGSETGLSDTMNPGDIANLTQSSDLAFRASFEGSVPDSEQRYWRALVLESFDGKGWQLAHQRKDFEKRLIATQQDFKPISSGTPWRYQVIAEPSPTPWLYALDLAERVEPSSNIWLGQGFQLLNLRPLMNSLQYQVASFPQARLISRYPSFDRKLNLLLPNSGNPKTRQWISKLRSKHTNVWSFINAVKQHFLQYPFSYTLTPALMPSDPVDTFLFEQQAGFCAHYASAFAYALRLGGVPARVVTGYQGGEQTSDNVLSIYQYDAHAWVEAWLPDSDGIKSWTRFDPTAWVAPNRIRLGLQAALQEQDSFLSDQPFALIKLKESAFFNQLRLLLANIDYQWSRWVLGFNRNTQHDLFKNILGSFTTKKLIMFGLASVTFICLLLALYFLPKLRQPRRPQWQRFYQKSLKLLNQIGLQRTHWQGVQAFSDQVKQKSTPAISECFNKISRAYQTIAYQDLNPIQQKEQQAIIKQQYQVLKKYISRD